MATSRTGLALSTVQSGRWWVCILIWFSPLKEGSEVVVLCETLDAPGLATPQLLHRDHASAAVCGTSAGSEQMHNE
jgi:hypothetical protein